MRNLINKLDNGFKLLFEFGLFYTFIYFFSFISKKIKVYYRKLGIKKVYTEFKDIFDNFKDKKSSIDFDDTQKNIFVFWAQGFKNASELQVECINRIKYYFPDFNLVLLDLTNYKEIISINSNIENLFKKKKISVQCFSDILRFNLIFKYGGFWVDATLLFFGSLPLEVMLKRYKFYSLNIDTKEKKQIWGGVYNPHYTTYFFGCCKGNLVMKCAVDFYNDYFKKHKIIIDYFLNDYILIICSELGIDDYCLNKIPFEGKNPYYLSNLLNGKRNFKIEKEILINSPQKLDWRTFDLTKFYAIMLETNLKFGSDLC